ncbi:MAG: hypothetical protein QOG89_1316 [Thermomicrobiales bacterium]|nr:hypothetical protein [Thermomicrobiales bacterium]
MMTYMIGRESIVPVDAELDDFADFDRMVRECEPGDLRLVGHDSQSVELTEVTLVRKSS